ncbi:MAG: CAP domain-containing protein [Candidatus Sericytochromatia bacterium]
MKNILYTVCTTLFLSSCFIVESNTKLEKTIPTKTNIDLNQKIEISKNNNITSNSWDKSKLDLARNQMEWSTIEKDILLATNMVRTNPSLFAKEYIEPLLDKFDGNILVLENKRILTQEGKSSYLEAIEFLKKQVPVNILEFSNGIRKASLDHVNDTGPKGLTQHEGSNKSTPWERLEKYGEWSGEISENISFGTDDGIRVVIDLVTDDGVSDRGHRINILDPKVKYVGIACGPHSSYGIMCVQDFTSFYKEK